MGRPPCPPDRAETAGGSFTCSWWRGHGDEGDRSGDAQRAGATPLAKPSQAMLWRLLRGSPGGVRFRHQHAVGPYVADFYCATAKLVIELDGAVHDNEAARDQDQRRDDFLREEGLSVLRILAADVLRDPVAVADGLVRLCTSRDGPSTTQLR